MPDPIYDIYFLGRIRQFFKRTAKDDLFRRIAKNTSYLFSANVISSILGFVQSILVARFLGVQMYGIFALVITYIQMMFQLVDFRVWEAVIRYMSDFMVQGDRPRAMAMVKLCYGVTVITGIVAWILSWVLAPLAARFLHNSEIEGLAFLASFTLLFSTTDGTSNAILRVFNKFRWITIQQIARASTNLILVIVVLFFFTRYSIKGIICAYVLSAFGGFVIFSWFSYRIIRAELWDVHKESPIRLLKGRYGEIAKFMFHTNMGALWGMVVRTFDVLILGHFRSATEVGYFKMAKNFLQVIGRIQDPIYNSVFPEITRLWESSSVEEFNRFLKSLTIMMSGLFIPLALGVFLLCGVIIEWTVGAEYTPAALSVRIMIWGITIGSVFTWARPTIIAIGKPVWGNIAGIIEAVSVLVLSFLLVPAYGYLASSSLLVLNYVIGHVVVIGGYMYHIRQFKNEELHI